MAIRRKNRCGLGNYDDNGNGNGGEPEPEDYTISPCGPLGSRSCVGQVEGKFLGEFKNDHAARQAICAKMEKERFWPSVWQVSDHGNAHAIDPECDRRKAKRARR